MPTKRAWIFLIIAAALYFLANQTQVGWLYVITAGIVGLLLAAFFYGRGMLKPIRIERNFRRPPPTGTNGSLPAPAEFVSLELAAPTFHEDDPLDVVLQVNAHRPVLFSLPGGQEAGSSVTKVVPGPRDHDAHL